MLILSLTMLHGRRFRLDPRRGSAASRSVDKNGGGLLRPLI